MKALRDWPLLLVVLAVSIIVLILGWIGLLRPLEDLASVVVAPVQYTVQAIVRGLGDFARTPYDLQQLRSENKRLQSQVDELIYQITLLREIELENKELRDLLNMRDQSPDVLGPGADLVFAEVIGRDPSNLLRFLMIDRGSKDGLAEGMPVMTARGLVGQVREVHPSSAKVMLLTDPASAINALVQRSRATGIVEGQTGNNLVLRYLPQTAGVAQEGDLVLTSGLGGHLPRRLLIGEIVEVRHSDVEMFQEARLRPAVDLDRLEAVIVVRQFTPVGVEAAAEVAPGAAGNP
ncbi:MAG: rod shape-determining protein MreC [Anaerolineae bacterium]